MAPPTLRLCKILFPSEVLPPLLVAVLGMGLPTLCCCCGGGSCCCLFTDARPVMAPPLSRLWRLQWKYTIVYYMCKHWTGLLEWTTWTGIFWFLISFFTFFGTGWCYFIEKQCLFCIFCFKLECWHWLMPMLAILKEINYPHNCWIHKFSRVGCWLHVRVNLLLPYRQLNTYMSASVIITSFLQACLSTKDS